MPLVCGTFSPRRDWVAPMPIGRVACRTARVESSTVVVTTPTSAATTSLPGQTTTTVAPGQTTTTVAGQTTTLPGQTTTAAAATTVPGQATTTVAATTSVPPPEDLGFEVEPVPVPPEGILPATGSERGATLDPMRSARVHGRFLDESSDPCTGSSKHRSSLGRARPVWILAGIPGLARYPRRKFGQRGGVPHGGDSQGGCRQRS